MQMLLLEGDDMNQKTGICILLCLVLLLVFGIWYQKRGVENTKNTQEQYASETEHTVLTGTPYKETENAYISVHRTAGWLFFYRMEKPYIWKPGFEVRI